MSDRPVVAYLVNQYPKVSHTFIRREILALETLGVDVLRFSVRGWNDELRDAGDLAERQKTSYVLRGGALSLLLSILVCAVASPGRFLRAFVEANRIGWRGDRPLLLHWVYFAEACWLRRALPDTVCHLHAHFGTNPATVAMLTTQLGGPPFSFTVHGPEEFDKPISLKLGRKIARAKFVAAVSSFGKSQLQRWANYRDWAKINVVHCGLDTSAFAEVVPANADPAFVCIGRLCEQKGQMLLVEACKILRDDGVRFSLVLVGDGEMRAEVESAIRANGLESAITITGWVDEARVRAELLAARVMVLPSFAEGLPVAIMEAMALKRPVISTYIAGIPELVRTGEDGIVVPAGDVAALAAAMRELAEASPARLAAMGNSARERVLQRHDIMVEAAKLKRLMA